jgi:hypothetical protein
MQNNREGISRLRQSIVRLSDEAALLLRLFLEDAPILRGNVYPLRRRCGKSGCKCVTHGELHESMVLSSSEAGRTRLRTVPKGSLAEWRILTKRYLRLRHARARLVVIYAKLISLTDELEQTRRVEL